MATLGPQTHRNSTHTVPFNVTMPSAELERLDRRVDELKERGRTMRMPSRAKLIRVALNRLLAMSNDEIEAELERWKLKPRGVAR